MKKILLVGKFNAITKNIYRSIQGYFYVQFCPADIDVYPGMYDLVNPELTLFSLIDFDEKQEQIFQYMKERHSRAKVLCLGNQEEIGMFGQLIEEAGFCKLYRPVTIREITDEIGKILDVRANLSAYMEKKVEKRRRILFIDDSPVQLRVLRGMLQGQQNLDIDMATSTQEAMLLIRKNVPDLIFLDYDMPQCDGKKSFEMLQENPISSDIPVVFLTGISQRKKVLSVLTMYPADYILKPVDQDKILEVIHNILR